MRRTQTGFLRYYAAAMVVGLFGVALYFLIYRASMTLSILIWLPLAISLVAALLVPRGSSARAAAAGSLVTLGIAISFLARFKLGHAGLQFVTDKVWISALGIHYKLGLDGLNVAAGAARPCILFSAALVWSAFREWDRPRVFYFHFGLAAERRARRVLRPGPGAVRRASST